MFPGSTAPIAAGRPGDAARHRGGAARATASSSRSPSATTPTSRRPTSSTRWASSPGSARSSAGSAACSCCSRASSARIALQYITDTDGYLERGRRAGRRDAAARRERPGLRALHKEIARARRRARRARGLPEEVVHQVLDAVTEPGRFADLVAGYIELPVAEKQGLLETLSRRGAAAPRARARPAPDRHARGAGRDQVAGPGGARRAPARDVPARADEGDPEGARRRRPVASEIDELREKLDELELPQGGAHRGRARARPPRARRAASRWKRR